MLFIDNIGRLLAEDTVKLFLLFAEFELTVFFLVLLTTGELFLLLFVELFAFTLLASGVFFLLPKLNKVSKKDFAILYIW